MRAQFFTPYVKGKNKNYLDKCCNRQNIIFTLNLDTEICIVIFCIQRFRDFSIYTYFIFVRYKNNLTYTFAGPSIISMNPCTDLPIYSEKIIQMFKVIFLFLICIFCFLKEVLTFIAYSPDFI